MALYPGFNNADQWMIDKVAEWKQKYPTELWKLFSPDFGDYLPLSIHVGLSHEAFFTKHHDTYNKLKAENPEAVAEARKKLFRGMYTYSGGPDADYR